MGQTLSQHALGLGQVNTQDKSPVNKRADSDRQTDRHTVLATDMQFTNSTSPDLHSFWAEDVTQSIQTKLKHKEHANRPLVLKATFENHCMYRSE